MGFTITRASWDVPVLGPYVGRAGTPSPIVGVLSPERQATFQAAPVAGAIRYFDPYAARTFGLSVPAGNCLTPAAEAALTAQFCVRSVEPPVDPQRKPNPDAPDSPAYYYDQVINRAPVGPEVALVATRYGQTEGHGGDARAGIFREGNFYLKGVGRTPWTNEKKADLRHRDGTEATRWCFIDSVRLGIAGNLFSRHGVQPIVVFGLQVFYPIGDHWIQCPKQLGLDETGMLLRGGAHFRNGAFVAQDRYNAWGKWVVSKMQQALGLDAAKSAEDLRLRLTTAGATTLGDYQPGRQIDYFEIDPAMFMRAARTLDLLRFQEVGGEIIPDLEATLEDILDLVARSGAEQYRWGEAHGTPSFGNFQIDGSFLDPTTMTAMPRRGAVATNPGTAPWGIGEGRELFMREEAVRAIYDTLYGALDEAQRVEFHLPADLDIKGIFYRKLFAHLQTQLLRATGLKPAVVARLEQEHPEAAKALADDLVALAEMENPGPPVRLYAKYPDYLVNAEQLMAEKSVVDLFGVFGALADWHAADYEDVNLAAVIDALHPIFKGDVARQRTEVAERARSLLVHYRKVMEIAETYATSYYGDVKAMRRAVAGRARFENRHGLYVWELKRPLQTMATQADDTGHGPLTDRAHVTRFIRNTVARYSRNVEALLRDGDIIERKGVVEISRTYDWVTQGVTVDTDSGQRQIFVRVPLLGEVGNDVTPNLFGRTYTKAELWRSSYVRGEGIPNMLPTDVSLDGQCYIEYAAVVSPNDVGVLQGEIRIEGVGPDGLFTDTISPYAHAYAVPDQDDLARVLEERARGIVW